MPRQGCQGPVLFLPLPVEAPGERPVHALVSARLLTRVLCSAAPTGVQADGLGWEGQPLRLHPTWGWVPAVCGMDIQVQGVLRSARAIQPSTAAFPARSTVLSWLCKYY